MKYGLRDLSYEPAYQASPLTEISLTPHYQCIIFSLCSLEEVG